MLSFPHKARCLTLVALVLTILSAGDLRGQAPRRGRLPAGVKLEANIPYANTNNPRQQLDLLLPEKPQSQRLPLVVFVHGGAWRAGDKRAGIGRLAPLVASGRYVGATISYRLSGEAKWPAQIHDCKAAVRWLRANSQRLGVDPERIGVWGSSAGGHLVAMLGTSGEVAPLEGELGKHRDTSSRVSCVVNFFGPTDFLTIGEMAPSDSVIEHNAADSPEAQLIGGAIPENRALAKAASPITYVTADDPPFLTIHGTRDRLVPYPQAKVLDAALAEVGVESTLATVEGGGHGAGFGPDVAKLVARFLDHHLQGEQSEWDDVTLPAAR